MGLFRFSACTRSPFHGESMICFLSFFLFFQLCIFLASWTWCFQRTRKQMFLILKLRKNRLNQVSRTIPHFMFRVQSAMLSKHTVGRPGHWRWKEVPLWVWRPQSRVGLIRNYAARLVSAQATKWYLSGKSVSCRVPAFWKFPDSCQIPFWHQAQPIGFYLYSSVSKQCRSLPPPPTI